MIRNVHSAALLALYAARPEAPSVPTTEPIKTMRPYGLPSLLHFALLVLDALDAAAAAAAAAAGEVEEEEAVLVDERC